MLELERPTAPLCLKLLGPFAASVGGVPLPPLRTRKDAWLLGLLVLHHPRPLDRAWLASVLWPESPQANPLSNLRKSLKSLRAGLGSEADRLISPTPRILALDLEGADVDLLAFDSALAEGAPASLARAVSLYRGPLLEGCAEAWVVPERRAREEAYLQALTKLAEWAILEGQPALAERYLRQAIAVDPLREEVQRRLMEVLAAGGSDAAAMERYRELRELLHRELNAEPAAETRALYEAIRAEARPRAAAPGAAGRFLAAAPGAGPGRPPAAPPLPSLPPERTLTFLFTDIEQSSRLWEQCPEGMRGALRRHDRLLREGIERHQGQVFKTVGDQFCAAFPTPHAALAAALEIQRRLQAASWEGIEPLRVRIALHTGVAEERAGDYFGPALNRVARLLDTAHGGQILLSLATQEVVCDHLPPGAALRDLGQHRLKDLARPEHVFQLLHPSLAGEFPPLRSLDLRPNNLPSQPTPLSGRERELEAVQTLLRRDDARLVTLVGPGGTGKTRLGLQAAADLLEEFADGVFFVSLALIRDAGLVLTIIAHTLGLQETTGLSPLESLIAHLKSKRLLLLLDNFEQVLPAATTVAALLAAAPQLKVLVTSRVILRLRGEKVFPVPPLALPNPQRLPSLETLSQYAAVALFIQRALDAKPEFAVTNENAPAVAEICHRLDG